MLTLKDETGKAYGALAEVAEKNGVNGERSLSGTIYSNDDVIHGVDRGWSINWKNEVYKVIYAEPIDNGETVELQFDAVHQFFYDMKKSVVDGALNDGSHTMRAYLDFIFNGSGYRYNLELDVAAFEKENFGYKNRLDLFNDIVSQTGVEFTVSGANVRIISQVGQDLSSIVKKGFNLNELKIEKNIDNFVTYKRGYGAWHDEEDHSKGRLTTEYLSPLSEIYGVLEDDPVVDERYTVVSNLQNRLKHEVDNSYTLSVGLNMEALVEAGYDQKQPRAGDYIMAINDDLGFKRKVRIVSYTSQYDINGKLIDHDVECNSLGMVQRQTSNQNRLNQVIAETRQQVQAAQNNALQARASADGKNTVFYGHEKPNPESVNLTLGDIWFNSANEDVIQYVWNGVEWRRASFDREQFNRIISDQTAKLNAFTEEIEAVRERADEAIESAGGVASLADRHGELINNLRTDADSALANAGRALDNITDLSQSAQLRFQELSEELDLKADWDALAEMDRALKEDIEEAQANARELVQDLDRTLTEDIQEAQSNARELVETAEDRLDRAINLKADQEALESLDQSVNHELEVLDDKLSLKASQITVDSLSDTVTVQKNRLDHTIEGLAFKADREDVVTLERTVTEQGNRITVNEQGLTQKADRSVVDDLNQTVEQQGLELRSTSEGLALKADRSTVNNLSGRVSTAENDIKVNADEISRRLTRSEVDNLVDGRGYATQSYVSNSVRETADGINRTIESVERNVSGIRSDFENMEIGGRNLLTGTEDLTGMFREYGGSKIVYSNYTVPRGEWNGDEVNATRVTITNASGTSAVWSSRPYSMIFGRPYTLSFYIKNLRDEAFGLLLNGFQRNPDGTDSEAVTIEARESVRVDVTGYRRVNYDWFQILPQPSGDNTTIDFAIALLKLEKGTIATDWTPAPEDMATVNQVNDIESTVTRHSTEIEATSRGLALKADQSTVNTLTRRVDTAESRITANANEISQRLTRSEVNGLINGRDFATMNYVSNYVHETADGLNRTIESINRNYVTQKDIDESILKNRRIKDTRNDNQSPEWYIKNYPQQTVEEFKRSSAIGLPNNESTYALLSTTIQWRDGSGGEIKQTAKTNSNTYERFARGRNTSWGDWDKITTSTDLNDYVEEVNFNRKVETALGDSQLISSVRTTANGAVQRSSSDYQSLLQTSRLYERVLGSTQNNIESNISRVVQTSGIIQQEVEALERGLSTRITQTEDSISVMARQVDDLQNTDLISEINIQADRQIFRVGDGRLMLTEDTTYINNNLITNRMLASGITADKITTGTLDASRARIINLDVNSLTGNLTNFVQTNWNNISTQISIDNRGINITGSDRWRRTYFNHTGVELFHGSGAAKKAGSIGYFKAGSAESDHTENYFTRAGARHSIGIAANRNHDITLGRANDSTTNTRNYKALITIRGDEDVTMLQGSLNAHLSTQGIELNSEQHRGDFGIQIRWNDSFRSRLVLARNTYLEAQRAIDFYTSSGQRNFTMHGNNDSWQNISMHGNRVINQSDRRKKRDIEDTLIDSLSAINRWTFVDYNWIDEELNSRQGRQLGLIAQDTPELAQYDAEEDIWHIDNSKQMMMNSHAIQQLANESTNKFKTQEDQIFELQQELSKANRRIKELEEAK